MRRRPMSKNNGKPARLILAFMCIFVACAGACLFYVETLFGWFLFFSPGWANGFPFGLSFQTVLSVSLTGYALLMLMTAAAAIGAIAGSILTLLGLRWERVGRDYRIWIWFAVGLLLLAGAVYAYFYVVVWQAFPDGYVIT